MATATIYANATAYNWSCNHEQGHTLAEEIAATSATGSYGTGDTLYAQFYHGSGSNSYDVYRSSIVFDTSSIPTKAIISSVTLNLYRKKEQFGDGTANAIYVCPVSTTGSAASNYNVAYFGTAVASLSSSNHSDNVNAWWQPSIDVSSINKGGNTIFGARHYHDYNNGGEWHDNVTAQWYFASNTDTNKPYLYITYTLPIIGGSFLFNFL